MTDHACHPTRGDAHRYAATLNARARDGRAHVVDRCRCGSGYVVTPYGAAVRRRRADQARARQAQRRAEKWRGAA